MNRVARFLSVALLAATGAGAQMMSNPMVGGHEMFPKSAARPLATLLDM
jgi:cyanophycinase-like exopeptidase